MPNERVVEVPWALSQLPQRGDVLDIGSCSASYLTFVQQPDRRLHCLDPVDCASEIPAGAIFHHQSLIGNTLPPARYDAVLAISTIEHIGLPAYDQTAFAEGDRMAIAEIASLLKPGCPAIITVPAGRSMTASWYRQYSPDDLHGLLRGWTAEFHYWGFDGTNYVPIDEAEVTRYTYREPNLGAGALAGIVVSLPRRA
jgi:hypothetical protein